MAITFTGFGSCVPERVIEETAFLNHVFLNESGGRIPLSNREIIRKFKAITGIAQRRYAEPGQTASDLGVLAAHRAISAAGIDKESLSGIIFAHNYGDQPTNQGRGDYVPSLASRLKHKLEIRNPECVAFDVIFGCPGWLQGVIIASRFLQAQPGGRFLVVSAETLSRVTDPHDRDSMIYADGAGAVVMENDPGAEGGMLSDAALTFANEELDYLFSGPSYNPDMGEDKAFIKMKGRAIYEFALSHVPAAMKRCLDASGRRITDLKMVLLHQANEKMDEAIALRFYALYGISGIPPGAMPMSIAQLGNSSVATIPTLVDFILTRKLPDYSLRKGDLVLLASVGAGMNINAVTYQF